MTVQQFGRTRSTSVQNRSSSAQIRPMPGQSVGAQSVNVRPNSMELDRCRPHLCQTVGPDWAEIGRCRPELARSQAKASPLVPGRSLRSVAKSMPGHRFGLAPGRCRGQAAGRAGAGADPGRFRDGSAVDPGSFWGRSGVGSIWGSIWGWILVRSDLDPGYIRARSWLDPGLIRDRSGSIWGSILGSGRTGLDSRANGGRPGGSFRVRFGGR